MENNPLKFDSEELFILRLSLTSWRTSVSGSDAQSVSCRRDATLLIDKILTYEIEIEKHLAVPTENEWKG